MNALQYHGTLIYEPSQKELLEKATHWGNEELKIKRFKEMVDGSFTESNYSAHSSFVSGGKLYSFLQGRGANINGKFKAPIESFFELNTSKEKCSSLGGTYGVYFEFGVNNKQ